MCCIGAEAVAVVANMVESAPRAVGSMLTAERKITGSHLERLAMVYLRQSSPAQVRFNVRSSQTT